MSNPGAPFSQLAESANSQLFQHDSTQKPLPLRSAFAPSTDRIYHPTDTISNKLDELLRHNATTDTNFDRLREEIGVIRNQVENVTILQHENTKIKQHLSVALGNVSRLEKKKRRPP